MKRRQMARKIEPECNRSSDLQMDKRTSDLNFSIFL